MKNHFTKKEQDVIDNAIAIMEKKAKKNSEIFTSADVAEKYCQLKIADNSREVFGVLFLDAQHQLIDFEILFKGGLKSASVYPGVIVKEAVIRDASAILICHNHPSNVTVPSPADKAVTEKIVTALSYIDVQVLDHIIVGHSSTTSFAKLGLL